MAKALALDFDGVLWDTQRECYVVAQKAWRQLFGRWAYCSASLFASGRWLARTGEEFGLVFEWAESLAKEKLASGYSSWTESATPPWRQDESAWAPLSLENSSQPQFMAQSERESEFLDRFGRLVAQGREEARQQDLQEWLSWQGPFPGSLEALRKLSAQCEVVAICTTKDGASIEALLATVGLKFPVYSKEISFDKAQQLRLLMERYQLQPQEVSFVDDLLVNVRKALSVGVKAYLAGWGYNTAATRQAAQAEGIPVLSKLGDLNLG